MTIGIYKLTFNGTDKVYIGQSLNIEKRLVAHKSLFNREAHSKKLQAAYGLYGVPTLNILEVCPENLLDTYENRYISELNTVDNGFNTLRCAGGGSSLEGEDVGSSLYTNIQIEEAFMYLVHSPEKTSKEISALTKVSKDTIDAISCFKVHKRLARLYPEEYDILRSRDISKNRAKNKTLKDLDKNYPKITSPEGVSYEIENCSQFSKLHNLNNAHVIQVLKGKEKQHKGWRVINNDRPPR